MTGQPETPKRTPRRIWNFTPSLPNQVAPYWNWPHKPLASLKYLLRSWNPVGIRCLFLIGAIVTWM
ncbi:MAG: lathosterol oxidase, partial [Paracoccaceae bacterium]